MADEIYHKNDISDESQDEYNSDLESDGELSISPSPALCQLQIQPYQFEPLPNHQEMSVDTNNIERGTGNVNWCECGHCRAMETEIKSKYEVPPNFVSVCLHPEVLKATLCGLHNLRVDQMKIQNPSLIYHAYRIFTWWIHNQLGQGVRKAIPSFSIWAIP